ncbi:MAG: hypothetical protein FWD14_07600 [Treponema sp.]|nr:hypothetical protein [Treponema sp.]
MAQTKIMTQQEKTEIGLKAFELKAQGKPDECERMLKKIPLSPYLAKFVKEHFEYFGSDFFEKYGWNLAEAEAVYGSDWLTR